MLWKCVELWISLQSIHFIRLELNSKLVAKQSQDYSHSKKNAVHQKGPNTHITIKYKHDPWKTNRQLLIVIHHDCVQNCFAWNDNYKPLVAHPNKTQVLRPSAVKLGPPNIWHVSAVECALAAGPLTILNKNYISTNLED